MNKATYVDDQERELIMGIVGTVSFHVSRGEFGVLPLNAMLLGLSAFAWWGRAKRLPIAARG